MLDEIDAAFDLARADDAVRVVLIRGAGGVFSTGHDLGTPEGVEYLQPRGQAGHPGLRPVQEVQSRPAAQVATPPQADHRGGGERYCIYAGWMLAAAMDVIFAADSAEFLGGFVEYNTIPWDIGVRRAKELVFESRFISADEAASYGLVNRVLPLADLERESFAWARRVAENSPEALRMAKIQMNKAQDAQGFTNAVEDSLGDYQAMMHMPGLEMRLEGARRLATVDLAVKGKARERFGQ